MFSSETDSLLYRQDTKKKSCNCFSATLLSLLLLLCILAVTHLIFVGIVNSKHTTASPDLQTQSPNRVNGNRASSALPFKHFINLSTPAGSQDERETAWAFTIASMLEHSYRTNGVKKGFLNETTYVPFSVQALAITIYNECQKPENAEICKGLQDGPERQTTNKGEVAWLYYLPELFSKVFPESICPYTSSKSEEMNCPGLDEWIAGKKNPLKFNITAIQTAYGESTAKSLLHSTNATLGLTMTRWKNKQFIPCHSENPTEYDDKHSSLCPLTAERVDCPPFITKVDPTDNCMVVDLPETNNDGEWELNTDFRPSHLHYLSVVGYNTRWRTLSDDVGGFIVKNSRRDSVHPWKEEYGEALWGQGSHSVGYWMSNHSTWDERMICANPLNPANWFSCTSLELGPTVNSTSITREGARFGANGPDGKKDVSLCVNKTYADDLSKTIRQPYEFRCVDSSKINCSEMEGERVFLDEIKFDENGLVTATFVYPKETPHDLAEVVIRSVPLDVLVSAVQPVEEQAEWLKNDPDNCGYYFLPFTLLQTSNRFAETWYALHFDIEWDDQSYVKNKSSHEDLDYSLIENSTKEQKVWEFDGPLPLAKREKNTAEL